VTVLADRNTRVLVQGMTGRQASWSTRTMISYGTQVVAGVVPGKGGTEVDGVPIFDFVDDAIRQTRPDASIVFVPPSSAREAIAEALEEGISLVVYPGDGLPVKDAVYLRRLAQDLNATLLGANTPGLISPGQIKLGFMPAMAYSPGDVGVITKSGSLSYEACLRLTSSGLGQSTVVGIGGDPVRGMTTIEALELFNRDPGTNAVLLLGEIGGVEEYAAAEYAQQPGTKPVVAVIVGKTAPIGRRLGHAGALITGDRESYQAKARYLSASGVQIVERLPDLAVMMSSALRRT
jgi:succinyl-CoA synthetase alpha subunit